MLQFPLAINEFRIHCRKAGSIGVYSLRVFTIDPEPGENLIDSFYRHHGQEWELGRQFNWTIRYHSEQRKAWEFFLGGEA